MKKLTKEEIRINIYKQDETQKLIEKYGLNHKGTYLIYGGADNYSQFTNHYTPLLVAIYGTLKQAINKAVNCENYVVQDNYCDMWNFGRIEYLEVVKL